MLNIVVNKTGKEDNLGILNKVVNTTAIDKDLIEANPVLDKVVNTIDPINPSSGSDGVSSCVIACIDKNIKEVQCVACINTCEIDTIKNTTCVSLEEVNANYVCAKCIEADSFYVQDLRYDTIQVNQCTESPKAVVAYDGCVLCSSHKVCVDDDTVYSKQVCSDAFYGTLNGKASNADCFDGRTFTEAKTEILSGKAKCSELADYAKNLCIESCTSGSGFIPFVDNKCVMFLAEKYNPKVMFNENGIEVNIDGCISAKSVGSNDVTTQVLNVSQCAMFNSPVYFYNDIYQCGNAWCTHAQNIYTCSDTITMREGATIAGNAQIKVCKYDGENNGVIFLGTDGTLRVGDENNCQPVLTRSEEKDLTDGHVLVWDSVNKCTKDGGESVVTCAYVRDIGTACKEDACLYTACTDCDNRTWTDEKVCTVGTDCYNRACACAITMDALCYTCSKSYTDTKALCACVYSSSCGHTIGSSCKSAACLYTACTDCDNRTWTDEKVCTVGTDCYNRACSCALNTDKVCYACSKKYADTKSLCACVYASTCGHTIGSSCKTAACLYASCADSENRTWTEEKVCEACINSYNNTCTVGTYCYNRACACAISMDTLCYACSKSYTCTVATDCYNRACACALNTDALCYACSKGYADTKSLCSCVYASTCGHDIGSSCKGAACACAISMDTLCYACSKAYADTKSLCACAYAATCGHAIGSSCKTAARTGKADTYGNVCNCVYCSHIARNVELGNYIYAEPRYIYVGNPANTNSNNIGCNANLTFCPTCSILSMGSDLGSAICLVGYGSCFMSGVCTKLNPKIVFATTDKQCGCLQYSQYDSVHPGAGLCWATNTQSTWFETDCVFANKFINRNGCQIGGYCATLPSPNGDTRYVLLDLGNVDTDVYYNVYNNNGTIAKTRGDKDPVSSVYSEVSYGIYGFSPLNNNCLWIRIGAYRPIYLWGKYPIKVLSNTTTNPGCTWKAPTIKPTCDYVKTVAGQCKSDACTYANTVAGQCKGVACTYANCAINACRGIGVMGVARTTNGQCWTKGGYWAYMTTLDGPNDSWNHVIKMDWGANVDPCVTGISIPAYNAHHYGIYYKAGCCGGHSGWTLVPDVSCVQTLSLSCASSIGASCKNAACAFAAACAKSVVPDTSTFAKCYGNSNSCVAYADQIRVNVSNVSDFYKIPFINFGGTVTGNRALYIDGGNAYPSYNPSTNVFCGYTVCVAQTLAVRNANGGFRLGNYCIYIE